MGYVYILENGSMPGLIKIGKTARNPHERAKELSNSTGVPTPFRVVFDLSSDKYEILEREVHSKLDQYRVGRNREFFRCPIEIAKKAIEEIHSEHLKAADRNLAENLLRELKSENQHIRDDAVSKLFSHLGVNPTSIWGMLTPLIYIVESDNWSYDSSTKLNAIELLKGTQLDPRAARALTTYYERCQIELDRGKDLTRPNDTKTGQQAEGTQKQAEAERRPEAENAQKQAETKNSNPDKNGIDENETTGSDWFGWGCAAVSAILLFAGIGFIIDETADKPVENGETYIDKTDSKTYIDRGKAKADKGEYYGAINDYDMAISFNPSNAKAYYYRGKAKAELGRHAAAIVDYDTAIILDPYAAYVYNRRGWSKYRVGQHAAAIADYDKLISRKPNAAYAYSNRGRVKANWGQYDAAIDDHNTAIRLDPDAADFYVWRSWAKYKAGRYFAAISDCYTTIRLDPDNARAYYYRGLVREKIGYKGSEDFRKALELAEKVKDWNLHNRIKRNMY